MTLILMNIFFFRRNHNEALVTLTVQRYPLSRPLQTGDIDQIIFHPTLGENLLKCPNVLAL